MRGMLIDDDEAVAGLRDNIGLMELRARRTERAIDQIADGLLLDPHVRARRADVEGRLRPLREGGCCRSLERWQGPGRRGWRLPPVPARGTRGEGRPERGQCAFAAIGVGAPSLACARFLQS